MLSVPLARKVTNMGRLVGHFGFQTNSSTLWPSAHTVTPRCRPGSWRTCTGTRTSMCKPLWWHGATATATCTTSSTPISTSSDKQEPVKPARSPNVLPGIGVSTGLAGISFTLADAAGSALFAAGANPISGIPIAIVLGMATNYGFNHAATRRFYNILKPGLVFCTTTVLRAGIICVGARLSAYDVVQLGANGIPIVMACVGTGLLVVPWLSKRMYVFAVLHSTCLCINMYECISVGMQLSYHITAS